MVTQQGRDLTGKAVLSREGLGYVIRSGKHNPGGWGHWVVDRTGDPGSVQGLAQFWQEWCVTLAVVGETVCPRPDHICPDCSSPHECACGLRHFTAETLATLPRKEGSQ